MKTPFSFGKIALLTGMLAVTAFSCSKEDIAKPVPVDPPPPVMAKAGFASETVALAEGFQTHYVEVLLHPKPHKAGTVTVAIEDLDQAVYQRDYVTVPGTEEGKITLPVEAGADKVSFRIMSADDDLHNADRRVKLTLLQSASEHILPEGKTVMVVTLLDNENYSKTGFLANQSAVYENEAAGGEVTLDIAPAAMGDGFIDLDVRHNGLQYGHHFTTVPATTNGKLRLRVAKGDRKASFRVKPVNDFIRNGHKEIQFSISASSENLKAMGQLQHTFTILEDGENNRVTIRSIHANFTGSHMYYVLPVTISGRVVSKNDNVAPDRIFIEDETGGIAIAFTGNNTLPMGELVTINLEGGMLSEQNEVLTISNIQNNQVERMGFDLWVVPVMTLQQLSYKPGLLEGTMVTLRQVSFANNGQANTLEGDIEIQDGPYRAKVRTESFASFRNLPVPAGKRDVTGVLIWTRNGYVIIPQRAGDIR